MPTINEKNWLIGWKIDWLIDLSNQPAFLVVVGYSCNDPLSAVNTLHSLRTTTTTPQQPLPLSTSNNHSIDRPVFLGLDLDLDLDLRPECQYFKRLSYSVDLSLHQSPIERESHDCKFDDVTKESSDDVIDKCDVDEEGERHLPDVCEDVAAWPLAADALLLLSWRYRSFAIDWTIDWLAACP